jgi:hypothetical protein
MSNKKASDPKPGNIGEIIKQGEPKYVPLQGNDKYAQPTPPGAGTKVTKISK